MLRPYQQDVARAVLESIQQEKGLTFSVEIARQGGKNELSPAPGIVIDYAYGLRRYLS